MKVTGRQIIEAIEKNGLPQTRGAFYRDENGMEVDFPAQAKSACAIGMAAINLGVSFITLRNGFRIDTEDGISFHCGFIESWNDDDGLSFKDIADKFRQEYPELLDREFELL